MHSFCVWNKKYKTIYKDLMGKKMFLLSLSSLFIVISCQCPSIRVSVSYTEQCAAPIKHNIVLKEAMDKYSDCLDTCDCRSHPNTLMSGHVAVRHHSLVVVTLCSILHMAPRTHKSVGTHKGYQYSSPNTFESFITNNTSLESWYIDGISLTHGRPGSRIHVLSFVNAYYEIVCLDQWKCSCMFSNSSTWPYTIPVFVGENYFCATGSRYTPGVR